MPSANINICYIFIANILFVVNNMLIVVVFAYIKYVKIFCYNIDKVFIPVLSILPSL